MIGKWIMLLGCLFSLQTVKAEWENWDKTEKKLFIAYNVGSFIDYQQSKEAFKNEKWLESNPLFPDRPHHDRILMQKLIASYIIYKYTDSVENKKTGLIAANVVQWGIVLNHESMGINFKISW